MLVFLLRIGAGAEVDLVVEGNFGPVAVEIKRMSVVNGRDLRGVRGFVAEQKARVGVVINNDISPRQYVGTPNLSCGPAAVDCRGSAPPDR